MAIPISANHLCRASNPLQCLQPLYCSGIAAQCFLSASSQPEITSVINFTNAAFTVVSAFTTLGSVSYWASTSSVSLAVTGNITVPQYCPTATFSIGVLPLPTGGCPVAAIGSAGPVGTVCDQAGTVHVTCSPFVLLLSDRFPVTLFVRSRECDGGWTVGVSLCASLCPGVVRSAGQ